ncbi:hypothetical protein J6590_077171 [Homalodisca vitripennis]|nr:hypothetical protein J6590_087225 [Homalodisca vitripennis]KAG8335094.1 hypothetical protein J6590_077171 [Homalodisca vitripennis]
MAPPEGPSLNISQIKGGICAILRNNLFFLQVKQKLTIRTGFTAQGYVCVAKTRSYPDALRVTIREMFARKSFTEFSLEPNRTVTCIVPSHAAGAGYLQTNKPFQLIKSHLGSFINVKSFCRRMRTNTRVL